MKQNKNKNRHVMLDRVYAYNRIRTKHNFIILWNLFGRKSTVNQIQFS